GLLALTGLFLLRGDGELVSASFYNRLPQGEGKANDQCCGNAARGRESQFVAPNQFLKLVDGTGWTSDDSFVVQVSLNVRCETVRGLVSPAAILLEALHYDPVQIAAQHIDELWRLEPAALGSGSQFVAAQ